MTKRCPYCHQQIDYLNYSASYTEFGRSNGRMNSGGNYELENQDASDFDENDFEYFCPECDEQLTYSFFDEEDKPEKTNKEIVLSLLKIN